MIERPVVSKGNAGRFLHAKVRTGFICACAVDVCERVACISLVLKLDKVSQSRFGTGIAYWHRRELAVPRDKRVTVVTFVARVAVARAVEHHVEGVWRAAQAKPEIYVLCTPILLHIIRWWAILVLDCSRFCGGCP